MIRPLEIDENWKPGEQAPTDASPEIERIRYAGWLHFQQVFTSPASASHMYRPDLWGPVMQLTVGPRAAYWESKTDSLYLFEEVNELHPGGVCHVGARPDGARARLPAWGFGYPTERVKIAIRTGWLRYMGQPGQQDPAAQQAQRARIEAVIEARARAAADAAYKQAYNAIIAPEHAAGRMRDYPLL